MSIFMLFSFPGSSWNSWSGVKLNRVAIMLVGNVCSFVLYAVTSMLYSLRAAWSWSSILLKFFCRFRKLSLAFSSG